MASIKPELPTINPLLEWESKWTMRVVILAIVTIVLTVILVFMFTLGSLKEISENFPRYRCNPLAIPFASNFGYDTKENFNFCLSTIFNAKAAEVFGPVYNLLGGFTQIIHLIVDVALGIRQLFSNFLLGVNGFVRNVRDRIQGLLFNIRMSFMKINNLMGRVYGTMYAVVWMGTSAMAAGFNIADNDLVQFLFSFCFDPSTQIVMADGQRKAIKDVVIGDTVKSESGSTTVTSLLRFVGDKTPMVSIHNIHMSREHYIKYGDQWLQARNHPDAIPIPSMPEIICLNVENHRFVVSNDDGSYNATVADYDEHDGAEVIRKTQQIAIKALNGSHESRESHVADYSLGIDRDFLIKLENGSWKHVRDICLGDSLWNGGSVLGTIEELCESTVVLNGKHVSLAQTIFDSESKQWVRAANYWTSCISNNSQILRSFVTERCGTLHIRHGDNEYFIRDYREVAIPEMEAAYTSEFRIQR